MLLLGLIPPLAATEPSVTIGSSALLTRGTCLGVLFTPDSDRVALIDDNGLHYWHLANARFDRTRSITLPDNTARLSASTDGRFLNCSTFTSVAGDKHKLLLWNLAEEKPIDFPIDIRPVNVFFSESGTMAAIEAGNRTLLYRLHEATPLAEFPNFESLRRFSASLDGTVMAFCDREGRVFIKPATTIAWQVKPPVKHHFASAALSSDGKLLATTSYYDADDGGKKTAGPIQIWSIDERKVVTTCDPSEWFAEYPNRVCFTPDGRMILAGDGAYLRGWQTATGRPAFAAEPGWNYSGPLVVSPNSRFVAVAYAKRALVWDLVTGRTPPGFEAHTGPVWEIVLTADGRHAVTSSYGQSSVHLWDTRTGRCEHTMNASFRRTPMEGATAVVPGRVRLHFSPDGKSLASVNESTGGSGPVRVWETFTGRKRWEVSVERWLAPDVSWTRHGLIATNWPQPVLLDHETGRIRWQGEKAIQAVSLLVDRGGNHVVMEEKNGLQNPVFDVATGKQTDTVEGIPYRFTPQGLVLLKLGPNMTNGTFNDIVVLRRSDRSEIELGKLPMGAAQGRLSPDGEYRVTISNHDYAGRSNRAFLIHEVASNRLLTRINRIDLSGHTTPGWAGGTEHRPSAFAFSPDHRLFAAIYQQGRLAVWDTFHGTIVLQEETGCTSPKFLVFSPDSRMVFTTTGDGAGGPVLGYDTAGGNSAKASRDFDQPGTLARQAVYQLASKPSEAVAFARGILAQPGEGDLYKYDVWIGDLSAPAFANRESAMKNLSEAGWRATDRMRTALASENSAEARQRLEVLLARQDMRPFHALHLLDLVANVEAREVLNGIAIREPESLLSREAHRILSRMTAP